ncbi:hypothetical protein [Burkholderia alba]|nr:hypothetical protein [Burkholderia alba]
MAYFIHVIPGGNDGRLMSCLISARVGSALFSERLRSLFVA